MYPTPFWFLASAEDLAMKGKDTKNAIRILNKIMELELAGGWCVTRIIP
jgi:hypothetical protein